MLSRNEWIFQEYAQVRPQCRKQSEMPFHNYKPFIKALFAALRR